MSRDPRAVRARNWLYSITLDALEWRDQGGVGKRARTDDEARHAIGDVEGTTAGFGECE